MPLKVLPNSAPCLYFWLADSRHYVSSFCHFSATTPSRLVGVLLGNKTDRMNRFLKVLLCQLTGYGLGSATMAVFILESHRTGDYSVHKAE